MSLYLVDYENVHDAGLKGIDSLKNSDKTIIFYSKNIKNIPFDLHVEIINSEAKSEYIKTGKTAKNYLDFQLSSYLGYCIGKGYNDKIIIVSKDTGYDAVVDLWKDRKINIKRVASIAEALGLKVPTKTTTASKASKSTTSTKSSASKNTRKTSVTQDKVAVKGELTENKIENIEDQTLIVDAVPDKKQAKKKAPVSTVSALPEHFRKKIRAAVKKENLVASKYTAIYKLILNSDSAADYRRGLINIFDDEQAVSIYNHTQIIYSEYKKSINSSVND